MATPPQQVPVCESVTSLLTHEIVTSGKADYLIQLPKGNVQVQAGCLPDTKGTPISWYNEQTLTAIIHPHPTVHTFLVSCSHS